MRKQCFYILYFSGGFTCFIFTRVEQKPPAMQAKSSNPW